MENISITVPMDYKALTQASRMFRGLAEDLAPAEAMAERPVTAESAVETLKEIAEYNTSASEEFDQVAPAGTEPEATAAKVFAQPVITTASELEAEVTTVAGGVGLDTNGIPWDGRIHASTKTKLVTGAWKHKRNVDAETVAEVEAELKGVMDIPTPDTRAYVVPATEPAPAADTTTPPAPPAAPGSITTFPALVTAITANKLSPEVVLGAVQAVGLQSFPLLAARPDLVPDVAQRLGL